MAKLKITLDDSDFLLIPQKFAADILPDCDPQFLKIYIYAMYLASNNALKISTREISDALSVDIHDVKAALEFFHTHGIVSLSPNGVVSFSPETKKHKPVPPLPIVPLQSDSPPSYSKSEIARHIECDTQLRQLFTIAQNILGKMLSGASASTLFSFYDWLGFSPDVIITLLQYCAEMEKKDMRYIEKVAISWHQMGISSVAAADEYIKNHNKTMKYSYRLKKIFGIDNRSLTPSEQKYIDAWYSQFGVSADLAEFAFDYCVSKTGKLSLAYMNKVLTTWITEGIKTPAAAKKSISDFTASKPKYNTAKPQKQLEIYDSGRYDYDEIDRIAHEKLKEKARKER